MSTNIKGERAKAEKIISDTFRPLLTDCQLMNGRPDCKNCGLDGKMITDAIQSINKESGGK